MITIVLIEPETSGNIGSMARVMANFGFEQLVLIDPLCKIDEESRRFAKNSQEILKKAKVADISILKKFDYIVGTTSKLGRDYNIPRVPITPSQLGAKLGELKDAKIALVLGREGNGLYNHEIDLCDFIVTIPTSASYDSMNISHALAILLYEIRKPEYEEKLSKKYAPVGAKDMDQIMKLLEESMEGMEFAKESKKETQRLVWRRMISKSFLTRREAFALMGFFKKIKK